ncbi:hypothetical protein ABIG06_003894 [Bradyrhizobium sp. USDA 326]
MATLLIVAPVFALIAVAPRQQKLSCWVYGARHDQSKTSILTLA